MQKLIFLLVVRSFDLVKLRPQTPTFPQISKFLLVQLCFDPLCQVLSLVKLLEYLNVKVPYFSFLFIFFKKLFSDNFGPLAVQKLLSYESLLLDYFFRRFPYFGV